MSKEKLTDHRVRHATAPEGTRAELWDAVLPGLGLRLSSTSTGGAGSKTWFVRYRFGPNQRRVKIGTYPVLGLAEARAAARQLLTKVGEGIDPAAERRSVTPGEAVETFAQVAESFVLRYAKQHNRSWKETERILNRYVVPEWGRRPIREITRRDVLRLLDGMVDRGAPVMAKQTHATVRKLFYWAVDRDIIDTSPCVRVPVPAHANDRDRVLTDNELRAVWLACEPLNWPFGPLVRLLILTGQRRDEVATLTWPDIDEEKGLWTIPRERNKSNRTHEVPLSSGAKAVLERWRYQRRALAEAGAISEMLSPGVPACASTICR
jgi:Arm DNA-binding domain/Phage integrase family